MIDHELLKSLEYKGEYGRRFLCRDCDKFKDRQCEVYKQHNVNVGEKNDVCRKFEPRIINPSAPMFDFDDYLEFLMSDYYRPFNVDKDIIVGKQYCMQKLRMTKAGGWQGEWGYSPIYKSYDQPYCRIVNPLTVMSYGKYTFYVSYRLFRESSVINENKLKYEKCYWKEKETSRKNTVLHNGEFELI